MATNRESKSSRSAGASGQGESTKANGSAARGANGSARDEAANTSTMSDASDMGASSTGAGNGAATVGNGGTGTQAAGFLGGIQQKVTSRVDEQKNRAADGLGGIADVFRNAGNELRNENETLAQYVDMASDQLRRFADTIRQRGVADMLDDVNSFARQRPALFIGGAFLVGIGVARFLKSSADRSGMRQYGDNFSSVDPMTAGPGQPSYSGDLEAGGY